MSTEFNMPPGASSNDPYFTDETEPEDDEELEPSDESSFYNVPMRIFLQTGCDDEVGDINWNDLSQEDVTWCRDRIGRTDIEYVRLSEELRAMLTVIAKSYRDDPSVSDLDDEQPASAIRLTLGDVRLAQQLLRA